MPDGAPCLIMAAMQQDTQETRHASAVTQYDKELEGRIKRALAGFATSDNISHSAGDLFRALGFVVVNNVTERKVSFDNLYERVQNKEANKRLEKLLSYTEGCYYAGSLTTEGGEEYRISQGETVTQPPDGAAQGDQGAQATGSDDTAQGAGASGADAMAQTEHRKMCTTNAPASRGALSLARGFPLRGPQRARQTSSPKGCSHTR